MDNQGAQLANTAGAAAAAPAPSEEPTETTNFMYRAHASNRWIALLVVGSVLVGVLLLWGAYRYWNDATSAKPDEAHVLRMVIIMGALGGTLHWMSSLVNYIGNGNFYRRWIPYYVLAPFQGAALALLVYLLLRVGVLAPAGNSTQSLNLVGLYAFSGLAGLFSKQAIEMLRDVFTVIFKRIDAKDTSLGAKPGDDKKPQASAPAGGKTP